MAKSAVYRRQGLKLADHEALIQEAVTGVREGQYRSVAHVCCELKLVDFYVTVNRWYHGRTKPRLNAHTWQQLLNPTQEKVLHNWIKFLGSIGIPLLKRTIRPKVEQLCGCKPSCKWVECFTRRNPDCTLGQGSGLDGQRACQFNFTNVNDHFEQVQKFLTERTSWFAIFKTSTKLISKLEVVARAMGNSISSHRLTRASTGLKVIILNLSLYLRWSVQTEQQLSPLLCVLGHQSQCGVVPSWWQNLVINSL